MSSSKYLFKYVLKGPDMAMMNVVEQGQVLDECTQYQSTRVVRSGEAAHRLFGFNISKSEPPGMKLRIHLENEQQVMFEDDHEQHALEACGATELTAFFDFNRTEKANKEASGHDFDPLSMPTYADIPETYTQVNNTKSWKIHGWGRTLGRINDVSVTAGDVFYLCMLLNNDHWRGKKDSPT